jgi:hypothetical protein
MEMLASIAWAGKSAELVLGTIAGLLITYVLVVAYRRLSPKKIQRAIDKLAEGPIEETRPPGEQMPEQIMFARTSKFARTETDIGRVLAIRAMHFGDDAPASGDAYTNSRLIETQLIKLVYKDGTSVGFWGVLPVSKANFEAFCAGQRTHEQMFSDAAISWDEAAKQDALYLYFTGLVAAPPNAGYSVIFDALAFFRDIHDVKPIAGIACYAEREAGQRLIDRSLLTAGFRETGAKLGVVSPRPVVACEGAGLDRFVATADKMLAASALNVPKWDDADRQHLFARIKGSA